MISKGQVQEAKELIEKYKKQEWNYQKSKEKAARDSLEKELESLPKNEALEIFLLTISEMEHDALSVDCLPREEHIQRIQKRNLNAIMAAATQLAFYYNVEPKSFLEMMTKLPTKPYKAFRYRSWYDALREHQKIKTKEAE